METTGLTFDQYGRYALIAEAVTAASLALGQHLRVLDVGGYSRNRHAVEELPARRFLPEHDITVLDQPASQLPGYVQGDGRGLQFADASFDLVISCDTLEHVPAVDRAAFWSELLRVARYGVLLIAPFASPEAVAAERIVRQYIQTETGSEQLQLAEHASYGLPDHAHTTELFARLGLRHASYASGYVHAWLPMMLLHHTNALFLNPEFGDALDDYYIRFLRQDDRCEPAYRRLWVVEKQAQADWFEQTTAALSASAPTHTPTRLPGWPDLAALQVHMTAIRGQAALINRQAERIAALEQELAWRVGQLEAHQRHSTWLEQQASQAHSELERVRHGRVMRVMNRFRRR